MWLGFVLGQMYVLVGGVGLKNIWCKFFQVFVDLWVWWCSVYVKIGVGDVYIINDLKFCFGKICVVIGE